MTKLRPASKRWGIVVGVDEYVNAGEHLHNLKGCVADAREMFRVMTDKNVCGFLEDHVKLLIENPTYRAIESAFEEIGDKMARGDELWFYYAGHGYSERRRNGGVSGYLLPSDVELGNNGKLSARSCISHSGLRDDFVARYMEHGNITVVLFLDCCCAASVGLSDGNRGVCVSANEVAEGFKESFRDLDRVSVVGGDGDDWDFKYLSFMATDQSSKAKEDSSGGLFTKYLIEGLKGGRADFPTFSRAGSDCCIRAGSLGMFLGRYVQSQPPRQEFDDMNYPLSVSSEKKALQMQMSQLDRQALDWLRAMGNERKIDRAARQFAEDVIEEAEASDFKYTGLMRNLMRLFGDPTYKLSRNLDEGAILVKAFYELKTLLEGKNTGEKNNYAPEAPAPLDVSLTVAPLTTRDMKLLKEVAGRINRVDGCLPIGFDLSKFGTMSQDEAAAKLDLFARERMRRLCGKAYRGMLYGKMERDRWHKKATDGAFDSELEKAVYRLICDDESLQEWK